MATDNIGFTPDPIPEAKNVNLSGEKTTEAIRDVDDDTTTCSLQEASTNGDAVDSIQRHLGGYGRYQILIYILLSLVYMRGGWHVWVPIYQTWTPSFHCSASAGKILNDSVPSTVDDDGNLVYAECKQYVNYSDSRDTEACTNGWTYLWESDYTSIVSWMDLVCERAYQVELTTTMYMVGTTLGVIFLSPLGDIYGAKKVMLACLWVQAVLGVVLIWAENIIAFCLIKVLIGMCNMTIALSAYVLMTEAFDASHRELPTIAMQFFWAMGILTLTLLAYLIPAWQNLQLTISLPINVMSLSFIILIPESLPWLLSKGRVKEAEGVVHRFTNVNKLPTVPDLQSKLAMFTTSSIGDKNIISPEPNTFILTTDKEEANERQPTIFTLFKTSRMRTITLVMFYLFLVNALAYFGIMYSTPQLAGDRFLNLCLLGLVEIPAYVGTLVANRWIGRRRSVCIFLFICGACNLAVIFVPEEAGGINLHPLKTTLVMIGKFGITGSYSALYLYASEVFPTVIRNQAIGASSFFENIGSIAAPNMVYGEAGLSNLPLGIFGGMTIVGSLLVLLLPETHNKPLPQTIADIENRK